MRSIGQLDKRELAERFTAYLIGEGIDASAESSNSDADGASWTIWVHDEDRLDEARGQLAEFCRQPDDRRYAAAISKAAERLREKERREREIARRMVDVRQRWSRGQMSGPTRLTLLIVVATVAISFLAGMGRPNPSPIYRKLLFVDFVQARQWPEGTLAAKTLDIRHGEIWRLISPAFLHGDLMHLAFNMYAFFVFGSQIESRRGPWTLLGLFLWTAVTSVTVASLMPSQIPMLPAHLAGSVHTIGMSGVVYGLAGFIWLAMRIDSRRDLLMPPQWWTILIVWLLLGVFGVLESMGMQVSNWGHFIGLIAGMAAAWVVVEFRRLTRKSS